MIEYKSGAKLFLNPHLETELVVANGQSYGMEIMVKKNVGLFSGWVSYCYSRGRVNTQTETFWSNIDKPHAFSMVANYKFSRRFGVSSNFIYSTGRPITYPVAKYRIADDYYLAYSKRNEFRIPDYIRWDISLMLEGNLRSRKIAHSSWVFSIYNLLGRDNIYSIYFEINDNIVKGYKLSIFAEPIPTLTYNFRF